MKKLLFGTWGTDFGIFLLRFCTGLYMAIGHGYGKITAGPEEWASLGESMEVFGITSLPVLWGFLAAFSEFFCSILLALGLFTRMAAFFLFCTMGVAGYTHLAGGDGWFGQGSAELAFGYAITTLALIMIGAGKWSLDEEFFSTR